LIDKISDLQKSVEMQHGGVASFAQSVPVKETHAGAVVWEDIVHVFDLAGHPRPLGPMLGRPQSRGSDKPRFFAVLHQGPVKSPVDAVRAAIVAEQRR
jgi:hypothetical protein